MQKVPIAIVGAGNVTNSIHVPAWKRLKNVEIIAICDISEERAERCAKIWKIPKVYTNFEEILENITDENAVIDICTPPSTHASLSVKAMEAGFNVMLEKPMAMDVNDCKKIIDEYRRRKEEVKLCVIHNFLFTLPMLKIKSIIEEKKLDILGVDIRMLHTPEDEMISDRNHWVHSLPGGRFGENLIHPVYVLRNLLGKLAVGDIHVAKRGDYEWVNYDELYATFYSDDKKFGSVYISFNSPRWSSLFNITIYSKKLIIKYDGTNQTLITQGSLLPGYLSNLYEIYNKYHIRLNLLKDVIKTSIQIVGPTLTSLVNGLLRKIFRIKRKKSGHAYIFKAFVNNILNQGDLPYAPEEAYDATITFLKAINQISKKEYS